MAASANAYGGYSGGSTAPVVASAEQRRHLLTERLGSPRERGAPVNADDRVALEQRMVGGNLGDARDEADHEQPPVPAHTASNLVERVAANRVVGHVDAATARVSDEVDPVRGGLVVDHHVGADVAGKCDLLLATGDGDRARPRRWPVGSRPYRFRRRRR